MEGMPRAGTAPHAWDELLTLSRDEASERQLLERLLDLWRREHGAEAAGLYLERGGALRAGVLGGRRLSRSPRGGRPGRRPRQPASSRAGGSSSLPRDAAGDDRRAANDPLTLLLASALKSCRLKQELKEQQFQVNYRVVELEALYDVGLAVASTLDLDRLSEEILLRAVSLLDARRGALYILEDGRYRLDRTFGGEAAPWLVRRATPSCGRSSPAAGEAPAHLLPGAPLPAGRADRGRERPARV